LYALRDHILGLNAGRWDYIFSVCKTLGADPAFVLPDRADVTMTVPFMHAYSELLVRTCHHRGAHAMGGMAANIPNRNDPQATAAALERVRADKAREAAAGFDGTWVAHPGLIPVATAEFDAVFGDRPHQLDRRRDDVVVSADDLLAVDRTPGQITDTGLRTNIDVGIRYLAAWLAGTGAAAIHGLMEDAATAEISRAQLWQWVHHGVHTAEGTAVTARSVRRAIANHVNLLTCGRGPATRSRFLRAAELFADAALDNPLPEFLTLAAYEQLDQPHDLTHFTITGAH
jgi:malate synthase